MQPKNDRFLSLPSGIRQVQAWTLYTLLERVSTEDPSDKDVEELREILNQFPELWMQIGSLAAIAQEKVIRHFTNQPFQRQASFEVAAQLRQNLTLPTDSGIEKLVVEQCIAAHLLHYMIESEYIEAQQDRQITLEELHYWEQRLSASQRRLLRAADTLARLRHLALPTMQVNIGANQTNIAGTSLPESQPENKIIDQSPPASRRSRRKKVT